MDKDVREEAVQRHKRIAFLSDVLRLKHKHKAFLDSPLGRYDVAMTQINNLNAAMQSSRHIQRNVMKTEFKTIERRLAVERIVGIMKVLTGRETEPYIKLNMGGAKAKRVKSEVTKQIHYDINIGWMWNRRVWDQLYEGCDTDYGNNLILRAEKIRVNHKWIELFEVLAYHVNSDTVRNGYVARTKTPKKNTAFHMTASTAVTKAQSMMMEEMNLSGAKDNAD